MTAILMIPAALRAQAGGLDRIEVRAATVREALAEFVARHPGAGRHLFSDAGDLRRFVNVYVDGEDVRFLGGLDTPLRDASVVSLVPAVAGGSPDGGLGREELLRYSRHILLPQVGEAGQRRLRDSSVLCVGAGGLGSPASMYLAAAGVGRLGVVDFDRVEASNLQRQILHGDADVGRPKVESAAETLRGLNSHARIETHDTRLAAANVMDILRSYDVILDGADNFATRYLVNDACALLGKPVVHGSVFQFEGQASVFHAARGPCYRCLYPEPPPPELAPSCAEAGVLGILPGVIGLIQATEAVKLLLGIGEPLIGRLLIYDALAMSLREVRLRKDPSCPLCGSNPTIRAPVDTAAACHPARDLSSADITPEELKGLLDAGDDLVLLDVREPHEAEICRLPGGVLVPLGRLGERMGELRRECATVVYCKGGVRGAKAVAALKQAGFERVRNLAGGILAWSDRIDPSVPKY